MAKEPARLRRLLRQPKMIVGLTLTGTAVFIALFGPLLAPHDPNEFIGDSLSGPSGVAWLGTDSLGRDVFSRVFHGGRTVLGMAVTAGMLCMLGGVAVGLTAGYSRGRLDTALMRTMEVLQAFPFIVLVLLFVSLLGTKLWLVVVLVAVAWTPQVARVTRGVTLEIVERDFVKVQETLGTPTRQIIVREVLPNITGPILVELAVRITWAVVAIAAISFLGFGVQPPTADWGLMINESRLAIAVQPWTVAAPIVCIGALTVGITLIAEALSRVLAGVDRTEVRA